MPKYLKNNPHIFTLGITIGIVLLWIFLTVDLYSYNKSILFLGDKMLFPAVAWFFGLYLTYMLYTFVDGKLRKNTQSYIVTIVVYWIVLIASETIAYHLFDIQNIGTAAYSGLPICNCIHAAPWMQLSYFILGPIYLLLVQYLTKNRTYRNTVNN